MEVNVIYSRAVLPLEKNALYPLTRRLGVPHNMSVNFGKHYHFLSHPRIQPHFSVIQTPD
jgi:hypothetical protein